ncbi:MAG: hypothetical protein NUV78_03160 [Candidatus Zambryskibacteria bacterium]|nr:hypothetical protein [Candidatus Zambryskibacteria bacterium]
MSIVPLAIVGALVEYFIEFFIKPLFGEKYEQHKKFMPFIACALSIPVCIFYGIDEFSQIGLGDSPTIVGAVLTGLLAAAGSRGVHVLMSGAQEKVKELKVNNEINEE